MLSADRLERLLARCPHFLLVGLLALAVANWFNGHGVLTGFSLFSLGVTLGVFGKYQTEPGLWMLAVLFGSIWWPIQAMLIIAGLSDLVNGRDVEWPLALDIGVATQFWWLHSRVLWSIFRHNRMVGG